MTIYGDYVDPFELEERGIERLSVVYGVVPVHEDGRPYKEYGRYAYSGEHPTAETPQRAAKGIVMAASSVHEIGLFRPIKVSWQPMASIRPVLSRGISRWPRTAEIFSLEEIIDAAGLEATGPRHEETSGIFIAPSIEDAANQLDGMLDSSLGNVMLQSFLNDHYAERLKHAQTVWEDVYLSRT